ADGMRASGFMAVFVFGIMLGNKDSFGFKMGETEARRLDQYVETTAFIMRLFIFILLGSQVDFGLMNRYLLGGVAVVAIFMLVARPVTVFACALPTGGRAGASTRCCSCAGRARPASFPQPLPASCSA